jgi:hypothetical protein
MRLWACQGPARRSLADRVADLLLIRYRERTTDDCGRHCVKMDVTKSVVEGVWLRRVEVHCRCRRCHGKGGGKGT